MKRKQPTPDAQVSQRPKTPKQVQVSAIHIPEGRRRVKDDAVATMMRSIAEMGLMMPIVACRMNSSALEEEHSEQLVLVAGAHRLAAAKILGWQTIDCLVLDLDEADTELWEIAENLHRRDLSKSEREKDIRRYAALLSKREGQTGHAVPFESQRQDGRGHRPKGMASQIAEEMGVSTKTVTRALNDAASHAGEVTAGAEPKLSRARARLQNAWTKASEEDRRWFMAWATAGAGQDAPEASQDAKAADAAKVQITEEAGQ